MTVKSSKINSTFSKKIIYKKIDIARVLAIPLYGRMIPNIYKAIIYSCSIDNLDLKSDILIVYTHEKSRRKDYYQIIENLVNFIEKLSPQLMVMKSKFSLIDKFNLLKQFTTSLPLLTKLNGNFLHRLYLLLMIARTKTNIDYVYNFLKKRDFKVLVTFCDAHEIDNTFTQCARVLGKKTVTLQHGQYHINDNNVPENMALNNLTSDYFCAWGQATIDEYTKCTGFNEFTKIEKLGSLRNYETLIQPYCQKTIQLSERNNNICLMLNADNCQISNINLIKLINDFCQDNQYHYYVRFHPKNNKSLYNAIFNKTYIGEYCELKKSNIAFSVIYTSGVLVELLLQGKLFFLYQDENTPALFRQDLFGFNNSQQLLEKYNMLCQNKTVAVSQLNDHRNYFIQTDNVEANYLNFFHELIHNVK